MSVWDDYLAAAVDLDDVRRETDATVAAQRAAAEDAATTLTGVRHRIALQRSRLAEVASGVTRNAPPVEPLPSERAEAVAAFAPIEALGAATGPDIDGALRTSWTTLDAADATLTAATSVPRRAGPLANRPPGVRAIVVYGWFALLSLVALIEINSIAGGSTSATFVVLACALAAPGAGWLLGWLCLRLLSDGITASGSGGGASGPGGSVGAHRPSGALLGALLCAVPAIVGVVLATV
ncbi:MAG TPA: hypothetical protein VKB59_03670 [Micromonosporaceae bacterium]|nr:hypothetical protein [Micromonosporaceae bacterium]